MENGPENKRRRGTSINKTRHIDDRGGGDVDAGIVECTQCTCRTSARLATG